MTSDSFNAACVSSPVTRNNNPRSLEMSVKWWLHRRSSNIFHQGSIIKPSFLSSIFIQILLSRNLWNNAGQGKICLLCAFVNERKFTRMVVLKTFYYIENQNTIQDDSRWNESLNIKHALYTAEIFLQLMKEGNILFKKYLPCVWSYPAYLGQHKNYSRTHFISWNGWIMDLLCKELLFIPSNYPIKINKKSTGPDKHKTEPNPNIGADNGLKRWLYYGLVFHVEKKMLLMSLVLKACRRWLSLPLLSRPPGVSVCVSGPHCCLPADNVLINCTSL